MYSRTPLIRPPSESHWCGRIRGMVAREGFVYKQKTLSVTRNVVVWEGWSLVRVVVRQGFYCTTFNRLSDHLINFHVWQMTNLVTYEMVLEFCVVVSGRQDRHLASMTHVAGRSWMENSSITSHVPVLSKSILWTKQTEWVVCFLLFKKKEG